MIVLNQSLLHARAWLAANPPARVERKRPDGSTYTTVTPREWIRQGGAALAMVNLVLRARDNRLTGNGRMLLMRFRLAHSYSDDVDEWTRSQAVDSDVPLGLAASWAETRGLAAAIKGLLWDVANEDVPDTSERAPAADPVALEDERRGARLRKAAERYKSGKSGNLPDRNERPGPWESTDEGLSKQAKMVGKMADAARESEVLDRTTPPLDVREAPFCPDEPAPPALCSEEQATATPTEGSVPEAASTSGGSSEGERAGGMALNPLADGSNAEQRATNPQVAGVASVPPVPSPTASPPDSTASGSSPGASSDGGKEAVSEPPASPVVGGAGVPPASERPHVHGCPGDCDEGRECWRVNAISPEEAARRGIKLLTEEQVRRLCAGDEVLRAAWCPDCQQACARPGCGHPLHGDEWSSGHATPGTECAVEDCTCPMFSVAATAATERLVITEQVRAAFPESWLPGAAWKRCKVTKLRESITERRCALCDSVLKSREEVYVGLAPDTVSRQRPARRRSQKPVGYAHCACVERLAAPASAPEGVAL